MDYVRMGSTGTQVSRLCLGCMSFGGMADWTLNEDASLPILRKAVEAGINFFDTADIYSRGQSEEILGRGLKELKVRRDESVVATKVFNPMGRGPNRGGLSRKHISQSIDNSLTRLGMDYVDLYQIHRFDYETPIEETIEALDDVVKSGKALYIGASSMFAYQFSKYLSRADADRPHAVRDDAEPLQPALSRGGAGDEPAVPGRGRRPDPLEPACGRRAGRQSRGRHGALEVEHGAWPRPL